jgi:hypothetical protein
MDSIDIVLNAHRLERENEAAVFENIERKASVVDI